MAIQNEYSRLKQRVITFPKAVPPAEIFLGISKRHLIVNLLCPEIPQEIENEVNRSNLKPYELAVRSLGHADYLYDLSELENASQRIIKKAQLIADNTVLASVTCVIIVVYLEFEN